MDEKRRWKATFTILRTPATIKRRRRAMRTSSVIRTSIRTAIEVRTSMGTEPDSSLSLARHRSIPAQRQKGLPGIRVSLFDFGFRKPRQNPECIYLALRGHLHLVVNSTRVAEIRNPKSAIAYAG